jgi:hypothetical protein
MPIHFVKKFAPEATISLKGLLHSEIAGFENARCHKTLHASDVTREEKEFCPREFALMDMTGKKPKGQFIGTSLRTTFDSGDALSDLVREKWLRRHAVGSWRCLKCGVIHSFCLVPTKCGIENCNSRLFKYKEEVFINPVTGLSGSLDLLVAFPKVPLLFMVEVKTIDKDQFKELLVPKAEHRTRTNLYLRLIENSLHPKKHRINTSKAAVLYVCRGFGVKDTTLHGLGVKDAAFTPFKDYWVKRDDEETDYLWGRAAQLQIFRKHGIIPGRICPSFMCKRAQGCNMTHECFTDQYPPDYTWSFT